GGPDRGGVGDVPGQRRGGRLDIRRLGEVPEIDELRRCDRVVEPTGPRPGYGHVVQPHRVVLSLRRTARYEPNYSYLRSMPGEGTAREVGDATPEGTDFGRGCDARHRQPVGAGRPGAPGAARGDQVPAGSPVDGRLSGAARGFCRRRTVRLSRDLGLGSAHGPPSDLMPRGVRRVGGAWPR